MSAAEALDYEPCPFDMRLNRTPYLVLPKMAIQAMPMAWRKRLEALLEEADRAGLETPSYYVFRAGDDQFTRAKCVNDRTGFVRIVAGQPDPWADYRHATHKQVRDICPTFKADALPQNAGEGEV